MSVPLPTDDQGLLGRECPREGCSPAYFKIKPGTGLTGKQEAVFCPYCRHAAEPSTFHTVAQQRYGRDIAMEEAKAGVQQLLRDSLGLGRSGRKKLSGGMLSIEMRLEPARPRPVARPVEEELRRDLVCEGCGLAHAVFGIASWCPDCGRDIFRQHVHEELAVTRSILGAVDNRRADLGARAAARDIENSLEDLVSVFEAVLKRITHRCLVAAGRSPEEVEAIFNRQIKAAFQNVAAGAEHFRQQTQHELLSGVSLEDAAFLRAVFEKRHPITHNLGVVDREYLRRAQTGELEGREIRVTSHELERAVEIVEAVLRNVYMRSCAA